MANSSQTVKQRSTHGNQKTFAELRDASGPFGDVGVNDGSAIFAKTYWWRYVCTVSSGSIGATALAAATTQELDLHVAFTGHLFPEKVMVHGCVLKLNTAFSGGSISAITASVGDTGNPDEWVDAQDVFTGASTTPETDQADADAVQAAGGFTPFEAAYIPTLTLDSTGDNLDQLTAGELEVWFLVTEYPDYD